MTAHAMMDGFAFRSGSGAPLRLVGMAAPAAPFHGSIQRGECIAIRAGASVPAGCDTVAAREQCTRDGDKVWLGALLKRGTNVRDVAV
jgi:molybdopterin molybdotransferase